MLPVPRGFPALPHHRASLATCLGLPSPQPQPQQGLGAGDKSWGTSPAPATPSTMLGPAPSLRQHCCHLWGHRASLFVPSPLQDHSILPPCCPGAGSGGLSLPRHRAPLGCGERGVGPPRRWSQPAPLPPSARETPGCRRASPGAAARHSPWRCCPAMHRLPRRSPFPSLHLGLKYL